MKKLLTACFMLLTLQSFGQTFYTNLNGFKLGQYRETAKNELGNPIKYGKFEDGFVYEAFLLKPDTSQYILFEYAAKDTNVIWSIQVAGRNGSTDLGIKKATLGIDKSQTEKIFGKPNSKENIGEYGEQWNYNNTNLSLEINTKEKFSSLKILDNSNSLFSNEPDLKKIPTFDRVRTTLLSNDNEKILNMLSGDVEIYRNDSIYYFRKSFNTEQITDYSKVISLIKDISRDLSTVNVNNSDEYEENMRLTFGDNPKHVIKILKGHKIKEIVLKYIGGQYLIYEINAND